MIIPWILFARMRARNKGQTAKLASLFAVTATVCCLTLIIPVSAIAQSSRQAGFGSSLSRGQEIHWGFSRHDHDREGMDYPGSYSSGDGRGYWFKSLPWLGFASEESIFPWDIKEVNRNTDEDRSYYPLTGFLLFRYPLTGGFQPYLGIGPTIMSDGDGLQQMDVLDRVLFGFSYTF